MRLVHFMAYFLSKILPLVILPLGLSLILLLVGLIGRWRWPVITAVLMLWFFSLGLVSQSLWRWLEGPWQRRMIPIAFLLGWICSAPVRRHGCCSPVGRALFVWVSRRRASATSSKPSSWAFPRPPWPARRRW